MTREEFDNPTCCKEGQVSIHWGVTTFEGAKPGWALPAMDAPSYRITYCPFCGMKLP